MYTWRPLALSQPITCTPGALSPSLNQSVVHLALSRPLSTNQLYTWRSLALSQPISCTSWPYTSGSNYDNPTVRKMMDATLGKGQGLRLLHFSAQR